MNRVNVILRISLCPPSPLAVVPKGQIRPSDTKVAGQCNKILPLLHLTWILALGAPLRPLGHWLFDPLSPAPLPLAFPFRGQLRSLGSIKILATFQGCRNFHRRLWTRLELLYSIYIHVGLLLYNAHKEIKRCPFAFSRVLYSSTWHKNSAAENEKTFIPFIYNVRKNWHVL
jgi:hypothetical protein